MDQANGSTRPATLAHSQEKGAEPFVRRPGAGHHGGDHGPAESTGPGVPRVCDGVDQEQAAPVCLAGLRAPQSHVRREPRVVPPAGPALLSPPQRVQETSPDAAPARCRLTAARDAQPDGTDDLLGRTVARNPEEANRG